MGKETDKSRPSWISIINRFNSHIDDLGADDLTEARKIIWKHLRRAKARRALERAELARRSIQEPPPE